MKVPVLALLSLFLVAAPAAAEAAWDPVVEVRRVTDPVPANGPVAVEAEVAGEPTSVILAACEWDDAAKNASYCLIPAPMARGEDGVWRGESPGGFPGGSMAGYKLLIRYANGTEASYPTEQEYELFHVAAAPPRDVPAAPVTVGLLAIGAFALTTRRRA